jgi:hypothetical protein
MDTLDWLLAAGMLISAGAVFYFLLPPYGALLGLALGGLLVYVAKKRRDKLQKH